MDLGELLFQTLILYRSQPCDTAPLEPLGQDVVTWVLQVELRQLDSHVHPA